MVGQYTWRYFGRTVVSAWLILSSLFLLSRAVTDQETFIQSSLENNFRLGTEERQQLTKQLLHKEGLDIPLFYIGLSPEIGWKWNGFRNQYHQWLWELTNGRLGTSYRSGTEVSVLLARALRYTLPLTILAALISAGGAFTLAILTSAQPQWRRTLLSLLHLIQGMPLFLVAVSLLLLLANPDFLEWFPAFGLGLEEEGSGWWQQPGQLLYHLALPMASLILVSLPALVIQLDEALQQELSRPYATTARAKGAGMKRVIRHHALRNALLPTITLLTELLPNLVAGSVVVEVLFALPGMGRLLAEAAATQDYPVLLGSVTLVVAARLLAQLLADVLYQITDPRISVQA